MLFAEEPKRRARQVAADLAVLCWCLVWASTGRAVYELVTKLETPGAKLAEAAGGIGQQLQDFTTGLPGFLQGPTEGATGATDALRAAGEAQQSAAHDLAIALGLLVGLVPILLIGIPYARHRLRWSREASAAARLRSAGGEGFDELMARRALVNQPLSLLASVSHDPAGDVANGNVGRLAALELRGLGLMPEPPRRRQLSSPPS